MRIFNKDKTQQLTNVDLTAGRLVGDKLFVRHHEAVPFSGHAESFINEFGIPETRLVCDQKAKAAYDEYEDIQVFIPYTDEDKQRLYKQRIVEKIRRKYDVNDEIALTNDKDSKPQEYAEYQAYRASCKAEAKAELNL